EATVVREVFQRRADGAGWTTLARDLDRRGVRQRNGRLLSATMLSKLVGRRVYVGEASHGQHIKPSAHPAIIDEGLWQAANRVAPVVRAPVTARSHEESL